MESSCTMGVVAAFLLIVSWTAFANDEDKDMELLLDGIAEIAAPGIPGPLCVFGEQAFPVIAGAAAGTLCEPVVAAGKIGKGNVVAFGHTGYLDGNTLKIADTGQLILNSLRWAANDADPRIAVYRKPGLVDFLHEQGLKAKLLDGDNWRDRLSSFDVLCVHAASLSLDEDVPAVQAFVREGGGLLAADLGWGWKQLNPGKDLVKDHPANRLLTPAGILWADGMLKRTSKEGFSIEKPLPELCHAAKALEALIGYGEQSIELEEKEVAQAAQVVSRAVRSLPLGDKLLLPKIRTLGEPLTSREGPLARLALTLELREMKDLPPDKLQAHALAAEFPGAVPADAERVNRTIEIDTSVPDWHSTGLYAAPGEIITVTVPDKAAGEKLKVRIGCHSDTLWDKAEWKRCPDICRAYFVNTAQTHAANAFGGLIYVVVPRKSGLGKISIKISGAVEAPYYVLGQTDLAKWREDIRYLPAPWAELATDKVVLTVPSKVVRELDDPKALMEFWQEVLDACAELATIPLKRSRPERYVADMQISAGYMHAGYPIMTHLDVAEVMVDKDRLITDVHGGVWGLYHELGHNHQSRDWTFSGTGEVTVNLFTLYVLDKVCGLPPSTRRNFSEEGRAKMLKSYLETGTDFEEWKRKPFLALLMYIQLQETFSWDAFKSVFAEYRNLPANERPKDDDEKRDQWMVRFSRTVERNLAPFFEAWGVPTSEAARNSIADLAVWMPENFPAASHQ